MIKHYLAIVTIACYFKFGEVAIVTRSTDKETGKRKRFAFVEFTDYDPVDKCIIKVRTFVSLYSGDLNSKLVWYSNG